MPLEYVQPYISNSQYHIVYPRFFFLCHNLMENFVKHYSLSGLQSVSSFLVQKQWQGLWGEGGWGRGILLTHITHLRRNINSMSKVIIMKNILYAQVNCRGMKGLCGFMFLFSKHHFNHKPRRVLMQSSFWLKVHFPIGEYIHIKCLMCAQIHSIGRSSLFWWRSCNISLPILQYRRTVLPSQCLPFTSLSKIHKLWTWTRGLMSVVTLAVALPHIRLTVAKSPLLPWNFSTCHIQI